MSREEAIKNIEEHCYFANLIPQAKEALDMAIKVLEQEQKSGHWIFDVTLDRHYYCSECKSMGIDYWDYCPYCGAKMAKMVESQEIKKINCKTTKCENCQNHNYCDYEPQESEKKPKSECERDQEILKAYSDGANAVLDKIRTEIMQMPTISFNANDIYKADVLSIINKYRKED